MRLVHKHLSKDAGAVTTLTLKDVVQRMGNLSSAHNNLPHESIFLKGFPKLSVHHAERPLSTVLAADSPARASESNF